MTEIHRCWIFFLFRVLVSHRFITIVVGTEKQHVLRRRHFLPTQTASQSRLLLFSPFLALSGSEKQWRETETDICKAMLLC